MKFTECFHPVLRAIHWLMAAAIMAMLFHTLIRRDGVFRSTSGRRKRPDAP